MRLSLSARHIPTLTAGLIMLLLFAFGALRYDYFFSASNVANLFGDYAYVAIAAVGATFVILSGGIDLSVGSIVAFTAVLVADLVAKGWHPLEAGALALVIGTALGAVMGLLIQVFELPAFMVTLAGMFAIRAAAFLIRDQSTGISHPFFRWLRSIVENDGAAGGRLVVVTTVAVVLLAVRLTVILWYDVRATSSTKAPTVAAIVARIFAYVAALLGLALARLAVKSFVLGGGRLSSGAMLMLAVVLVAFVVARSTRFGRNVYAVGGSEKSARMMGVPVGATKIGVYTLAGFCSALAGLAFTMYKQAGDPTSAVGLELSVIAAVVIGGTLLSGGVGSILGTLIGVLILGLIRLIIDFQGNLNAAWTSVAIGVLLLAFVGLQNLVASLGVRAAKQ